MAQSQAFNVEIHRKGMIGMIEHNYPDLYGSQSVNYMKRKNVIYFLMWIIVLIVCFALIQRFITDQYDRIGTEQSIQDYILLLAKGFGCMLLLSIIWWLVTCIELLPFAPVRYIFEQHSQICALIFDILAVLFMLIISYSEKSGIDANNGHFYPLHSLYILPAIFVCLMNIAPPVHIREVIFPQMRWGRWIIGIIAVLFATGLFITDFL